MCLQCAGVRGPGDGSKGVPQRNLFTGAFSVDSKVRGLPAMSMGLKGLIHSTGYPVCERVSMLSISDSKTLLIKRVKGCRGRFE